MTRAHPLAKGMALGGLLASLWLQGNPLSAQETASPPTDSPIRSVQLILPSPLQVATQGQQAPAAPAPSEADTNASPWAKIPYLSPVPRPGLFLLPPAGPGCYTALDCFRGNCQEKPPPYPYRNLFYDNDFRYLDTPDGKPVDFLDNFKRIHLGSLTCPGGDDWVLSIGGEERLQIKNEIDSRLTAKDNDYQLLRTRVYGDLWYKDLFRIYVEYIDAQSYNQDLPPLAIDINHSDIQNLFVDVKIGEFMDKPAYARLGRQELQYGSQRLISPLDWANTRRTFEGAKVFWHSDDPDLDAFWVRPVVVSPSHFDAADANRQFAGVWGTYRPAKGQCVDVYYLYLDYDLPVTLGATGGGRGGYDVNTFGARWSGDHKACDVLASLGRESSLGGSVLWDVEGAYQLGDYSNRLISAGMVSAGLGYSFDLPMQPTFWAYWDYASGTPNLGGTGTFETFNQLFPFGHYYFGFLDEVGRENIHDWNFQASCYPTKWITAQVQYHVFRLDQARDALYGTPPNYPATRKDLTGAAGTDVGQEMDLTATFQLDRHNAILIGYSKLFAGDFIRQTGPAVSPELYYLQYTFRW